MKRAEDKAWLGIAGGICLFLSALFVAHLVGAYVPRDLTGPVETAVAGIAVLAPYILALMSAIVFVRGCSLYAKARQWPTLLGIVGGLVLFIGCLVLVISIYHSRQPARNHGEDGPPPRTSP